MTITSLEAFALGMGVTALIFTAAIIGGDFKSWYDDVKASKWPFWGVLALYTIVTARVVGLGMAALGDIFSDAVARVFGYESYQKFLDEMEDIEGSQ